MKVLSKENKSPHAYPNDKSSKAKPKSLFFQPQAQLKSRNTGNLIQRSSPDRSSTDPMHEPMLEQYRQETALPFASDQQGVSNALIKYVLAPEYFRHRTSVILNNYSFTEVLYGQVIAEASDHTPLWPMLNTRNAKINFIRFLVREDLTNCRPYDAASPIGSGCAGVEHNQLVFSNLCMGFATQFYVRYTDSSTRLSSEEITWLQDVGHIYAGRMLPKFRAPVFLAIYPGHAFNAFQIEADANDINSYLFFEPQNDQLFTAAEPQFRSYFGEGIITIDRLTGFNERGQFQTSVEHTFAERGGSVVHASINESQRMALNNLSSALRIAYDAASWRYTIEEPQITFETNFQSRAAVYSDVNLAAIFPYLSGRTFKRSPSSTEEILTRVKFLELVGRDSLEGVIPQP